LNTFFSKPLRFLVFSARGCKRHIVTELAGNKRQSSEVKKEVVFNQTLDKERRTMSTKPKSGKEDFCDTFMVL
jgi:hypothetical protein